MTREQTSQGVIKGGCLLCTMAYFVDMSELLDSSGLVGVQPVILI